MLPGITALIISGFEPETLRAITRVDLKAIGLAAGVIDRILGIIPRVGRQQRGWASKAR